MPRGPERRCRGWAARTGLWGPGGRGSRRRMEPNQSGRGAGPRQGRTVPEGEHQSVPRGHRGITPTRRFTELTLRRPGSGPRSQALGLSPQFQDRLPLCSPPGALACPEGDVSGLSEWKSHSSCLGQNLELLLTFLSAPIHERPSVCPGTEPAPCSAPRPTSRPLAWDPKVPWPNRPPQPFLGQRALLSSLRSGGFPVPGPSPPAPCPAVTVSPV